jgi:UDP-N-acetylmuramate: L-alanyl-gamma-D-glutamyl-meso-diaminopimelate ligase
VATTLDGARRRYPGRRVWAVLEPRSITAGRAELAEAWRQALDLAGGIAVTRPYHAERLSRPGGPGALDVAALAASLDRADRPALWGDGPGPLLEALVPRLAPGDVVVAMSSGGFGGFCPKLLAALSARA